MENVYNVDGHTLVNVSLEDITKIFAGEDLVANDPNAIGYALTGFMKNSVNRY